LITIIDYNIGNLASISNMLRRIGVESKVSGKIEDIQNAEKLILPGVGSFDYGMQQLHQSRLIDVLNEKVLYKKTPILGICLGVQLLTEQSDEGKEKGLSWIKGKTVAFDRSQFGQQFKIPHMGWTDVKGYAGSKLFTDMHAEPRFYFVHSFHLQLLESSDVLVSAEYGYEFAAGIEHENILGVQFHPEKSHKYGMKILENFNKYY
jgi:imidazole glycerol-phosphate synthase subunit HisH